MKCIICKIEPAMNTYREVYGQVSKVPECYNCNSLTNEESYKRINNKIVKIVVDYFKGELDEK